MKAVIDLKKLRSDVQSYQVPVPGTSVGGPTAIFGLALYPEDSSIHLTTTTTEGGITKSNEQDYIEIGVSNLDVANRVAKAMMPLKSAEAKQSRNCTKSKNGWTGGLDDSIC